MSTPRPRFARLGAALLFAASAATLSGCPSDAPEPRDVPPQERRVVTPVPALAEIVCAIGAQDQLVGVSRYCTHPPELKDLAGIGGMVDPNLEQLESLKPDLVLTQGVPEALGDLAERRAWQVEDFTIETLDDVTSAITRVGALLGREQQAAEVSLRISEALVALGEKHKGDARPKVLLTFGHEEGSLGGINAPGSETFLGECLLLAGGRPVVEGPKYVPLALEAVVEHAPDVVLILRTEPPSPESLAQIRADWAALETPASQSGRIHVIAFDGCLIPGPRLPELARRLEAALATAAAGAGGE